MFETNPFLEGPEKFPARKAIRKTSTRLFYKAGLFTCCKGNKKVSGLSRSGPQRILLVEAFISLLGLGLESTFPSVDLFLEQVSRELLRNKSQVANQRRSMTINVSRHLPIRETITIERSSKINFRRGERLSQGINADSSYLRDRF